MVEIGPEVANHVLFFFGYGGYRPGSFIESLIKTVARADQGNRARLALAFPEYVAAMDLAQGGSLDGIARLTELAKWVNTG